MKEAVDVKEPGPTSSLRQSQSSRTYPIGQNKDRALPADHEYLTRSETPSSDAPQVHRVDDIRGKAGCGRQDEGAECCSDGTTALTCHSSSIGNWPWSSTVPALRRRRGPLSQRGATPTSSPWEELEYPGLSSDHSSGRAPSVVTVVGGALAGVLLTGLLIFGIWMCSVRNRRPKSVKKLRSSDAWAEAELGENCRLEADGTATGHSELDARERPELESQTKLVEIGDRRSRYELQGDIGAVELAHVRT
ncbi:MAG: hypothetical protein Q9170_003746 [Blastenia crenularia]